MRPTLFAAALLAVVPWLLMRADAADSTITIDNFTFKPAELDVATGASVTWVNRDDIPHLVVGQDNPRELKSQPLDTGDHYEFVFKTPGTYRYFCSLHPHMQGTVVVK